LHVDSVLSKKLVFRVWISPTSSFSKIYILARTPQQSALIKLDTENNHQILESIIIKNVIASVTKANVNTETKNNAFNSLY
jgi:hypothetical protein